ncbi:2-oxoacid:acceptor oxidoreductase family protein [bacterium]|nr:2-oxoacid:acceptor oxidoreductase family protein [bacterium]
MEMELLAAGFGGQGVLMIGQLVALSAVDENKYALFFPSYGPAMRGGTANCTVIIGDNPIGSPILNEHEHIIVMNNPSFTKFEPLVKKGGHLYVNSSLVSEKSTRTDIQVHYIEANDLAEKAGANVAANIVMLGGLLKISQFSAYAVAEKSIQKKFASKGEKVVQINLSALKAGFEKA